MIDFSFEDLEIDGLEFESDKADKPNWYEHVNCSKEVRSIVDEARHQFKAKLKSVKEIEDKSNVKKKDYQLVIGNITEAAGLSRTYLKNRHQNKYQQYAFEFIEDLNTRLYQVFNTKDLKTKIQSQKDKAKEYTKLAQAFSELSQIKMREFAEHCFTKGMNEAFKGESSYVKQLMQEKEELLFEVARKDMQIADLSKSLRIAEEKLSAAPSSNVVKLGGKDDG